MKLGTHLLETGNNSVFLLEKLFPLRRFSFDLLIEN